MPTECSLDRMELAPAEGRAVVAAFDGGTGPGTPRHGATEFAPWRADLPVLHFTMMSTSVGASFIHVIAVKAPTTERAPVGSFVE